MDSSYREERNKRACIVPGERLHELSKLFNVLWDECEAHDGVRDTDGGHGYLGISVGERVAACALNAKQRHNVPRARLRHVLHFIGMHSHKAGDLQCLF
jgi:hypothetical protein